MALEPVLDDEEVEVTEDDVAEEIALLAKLDELLLARLDELLLLARLDEPEAETDMTLNEPLEPLDGLPDEPDGLASLDDDVAPDDPATLPLDEAAMLLDVLADDGEVAEVGIDALLENAALDEEDWPNEGRPEEEEEGWPEEEGRPEEGWPEEGWPEEGWPDEAWPEESALLELSDESPVERSDERRSDERSEENPDEWRPTFEEEDEPKKASTPPSPIEVPLLPEHPANAAAKPRTPRIPPRIKPILNMFISFSICLLLKPCHPHAIAFFPRAGCFPARTVSTLTRVRVVEDTTLQILRWPSLPETSARH